jgi:hypothetical protein
MTDPPPIPGKGCGDYLHFVFNSAQQNISVEESKEENRDCTCQIASVKLRPARSQTWDI